MHHHDTSVVLMREALELAMVKHLKTERSVRWHANQKRKLS
jgi:hypothetical protein